MGGLSGLFGLRIGIAGRRETDLSFQFAPVPLLEAVDTGTLEASLISPVLLDQFERFHHERIDALILANWTRGSGNIDLAELSAQIVEWKKKLNPEILAKADASRGRKIFDMTCGTCHKLFGQGVALGPDLTGSN